MKFLSRTLILMALLTTVVVAEPLRVSVSILPQAWLVERIGGDQVSIEVLVGQGQSPATYEPTPKQLERLSDAQLYFSVGVPFERIWLKSIAMVSPGIRIVPMADSEDSHEDEHPEHSENDDGHRHGSRDPHIWNSPRLASEMAEKAFLTLLEHLPDAHEILHRNHQTLQQELAQLDRDIAQMLAPWSGRVMMTFHPAWGYYAENYGLRQLVIEADGKEPTARQLAALIEQARSEQVSVILVQPQFSQHLARRIASAIGARVLQADPVPADYTHAMREFTRLLIESFSSS